MKRKIKIMQVVGIMNRGGTEVMLMEILKNLNEEMDICFLVNYKKKDGIPKGDFDDEILANNGIIKHIPTQWDIGPFRYIQQFKKIYNEIGKPEVVHIHLNAKSGIIALAAKIAGAKKIIVHSHGDITFRESIILNTLRRAELSFQKVLISLFATDFWSCSKAAERSLFYNINKINHRKKIINNAINVDDYLNVSKDSSLLVRNKLNINHDTLVIGVVGRIIKRKNLLFIIEVLNEYKKINSNFVFLNVGTVVDKEYFNLVEKKINEYNLRKNVIHFGLSDNIPEILTAFDLFISPAKNEAFGIVAIEAQAAGLPCMLSTEFPKEVDVGLGLVKFIPNFIPFEWANIIENLKNKIELNKNIIKEKFIISGFDIKENIKSIKKFYRENVQK